MQFSITGRHRAPGLVLAHALTHVVEAPAALQGGTTVMMTRKWIMDIGQVQITAIKKLSFFFNEPLSRFFDTPYHKSHFTFEYSNKPSVPPLSTYLFVILLGYCIR